MARGYTPGQGQQQQQGQDQGGEQQRQPVMRKMSCAPSLTVSSRAAACRRQGWRRRKEALNAEAVLEMSDEEFEEHLA
jgi:hypothetical protein